MIFSTRAREKRDHARGAELARLNMNVARQLLAEHEAQTGSDRRDLVVVLAELDGGVDAWVARRDVARERLPNLPSLGDPPEPPAFSLVVNAGTSIQVFDVEETSRPEVLHG